MNRQVERGSVTVFVVSITLSLLVMAGLVFDGGRIIAGRREADAVAAAAARAGAQGLDESGLRNTAAAPIGESDASARVQRYLEPTGFTGSATVIGDAVVVNVRRTQDLQILSLVAMHSASIEGSATARSVRAVRGQS